MKNRILNTHRAVTLTELLVVLAILSLLATLAVPVYVQKTEQARRAVARSEVRAIAEAEQQVLLTHGFFVPIHLLDNLSDRPDDTSNERDDWENYVVAGGAGTYFIDPFIRLEDQLNGGGNQISVSQARSGNTDLRATNMLIYWAGPFLNPQRVASDFDNPLTQQNIAYDLVLDPWGRPYVFYSPIGRIASNTDFDLRGYDVFQNGAGRIQIDDGVVRDNDGGSDDPFDRYAIVSFGSNGRLDANEKGLFNAGSVVQDDIFYTFAAPFNETAFNAF